jgi:hypothetical protein
VSTPVKITPEQDETMARLRESGHSLRQIAALYGFRNHSSVAHALARYEKRTGRQVVPGPLVKGRGPGRGVWDARLRPLMKRPMTWQVAHERRYPNALAIVTKLRRSRMSATEGGEWQFRTRKAPGSGKPGIWRIEAMWLGTRCTNCGALSPVTTTCPLCGYGKEAA